MGKSIGTIVNSGLLEIKEPTISEFTTSNILQQNLIRSANDAVRDILSRKRFKWGYKRTTIQCTNDVSTEYVAVTTGTTTVTSVDSAGASAQGFGDVTTDMYLKIGTDQTTYKISSVDTTSNPHTLTIENNYADSTRTASSYVAFQDEYAITATDFDKIQIASMPEGGGWYDFLSDNPPTNELVIGDLVDLYNASGHAPHRQQSGKPRLIAQIAPDSSDQVVFKVWPYPDDDWVIELWYSTKFSQNTAFDTEMFGGDAPDLAYDAVEARVRSAACLWDNKFQKVSYWEQRYNVAVAQLLSWNRTTTPNRMSINTYRRNYSRNLPVVSQYHFDHYSGTGR